MKLTYIIYEELKDEKGEVTRGELSLKNLFPALDDKALKAEGKILNGEAFLRRCRIWDLLTIDADHSEFEPEDLQWFKKVFDPNTIDWNMMNAQPFVDQNLVKFINFLNELQKV